MLTLDESQNPNHKGPSEHALWTVDQEMNTEACFQNTPMSICVYSFGQCCSILLDMTLTQILPQ